MFHKQAPQLTEAQKTQVVIDNLITELAMYRAYPPARRDAEIETVIRYIEYTLSFQREKLKLLKQKKNRKK